jgi:hypothetical protein
MVGEENPEGSSAAGKIIVADRAPDVKEKPEQEFEVRWTTCGRVAIP